MNKRQERLYQQFKKQLCNDLFDATNKMLNSDILCSNSDRLVAEGVNTLMIRMLSEIQENDHPE